MLGLSFVHIKSTWNATSWVELRIYHSKSRCFTNWATKLSCLPPTFAKKYLNNLELFYSQSWYTNIFSVVCTWYNFCNSMRKSHCHLFFPWLQIFPFWHIFLSSPKYKEGEIVVTWLSKGRKKEEFSFMPRKDKTFAKILLISDTKEPNNTFILRFFFALFRDDFMIFCPAIGLCYNFIESYSIARSWVERIIYWYKDSGFTGFFTSKSFL